MIITFARRIAPCAKNNQDPRAIFIQAGYKGNPREWKKKKKIRYSCGLAALRIIFTCDHRRSPIDGRIRALIKLMQPRATFARAPSSFPCAARFQLLARCTRLESTCARVGEHRDHGDFYERCYTL